MIHYHIGEPCVLDAVVDYDGTIGVRATFLETGHVATWPDNKYPFMDMIDFDYLIRTGRCVIPESILRNQDAPSTVEKALLGFTQLTGKEVR